MIISEELKYDRRWQIKDVSAYKQISGFISQVSHHQSYAKGVFYHYLNANETQVVRNFTWLRTVDLSREVKGFVESGIDDILDKNKLWRRGLRSIANLALKLSK